MIEHHLLLAHCQSTRADRDKEQPFRSFTVQANQRNRFYSAVRAIDSQRERDVLVHCILTAYQMRFNAPT